MTLYTVASGNSLRALIQAVDFLLSGGWKPQGGIAVLPGHADLTGNTGVMGTTPPIYLQALVREAP